MWKLGFLPRSAAVEGVVEDAGRRGPHGVLVARIDGEGGRILAVRQRRAAPGLAAIVAALRPLAPTVRTDAIEHRPLRRRDNEATCPVLESRRLHVGPRVATVTAAIQMILAGGVHPSRIARIDGQYAAADASALPRIAAVAAAPDAVRRDEHRSGILRIG